VSTHGYACPNPACPYVGVTDAAVHALVGDGHHGRDRIQDFRCQACGTKVSARRDTALYRLTTPATRVSQVLTALAEGLDQRAASRVFDHGTHTLARWLTRSGAHAERLHARHFHGLHLPHVQLDELRARLRDRTHVAWLWLAVDPVAKVIPALHLGQRNQAAAHALVHALMQTLAPGCPPVFTSDGLNLYFYALTAHFGQWVAGVGRRARLWRVAPGLLYGQVKKVYRRQRLTRVVPCLHYGSWRAFRATLRGLGLSGRVTTAFIERANLTLRRGVAGLARRTWATARSAPQLLAHLEWWRAYYHFSRPHRGLRLPLAGPIDRGGCRAPRRYWRRTPAMALGVTDHPWTVLEVLTYPLPPPRAQCA
jgi:IS1 family transposase/transposase-like protein